MNRWSTISQSFRDKRITVKFGVGIGLLLSLIVMVAVTGYLSMEFVRKAQESIERSTKIQRLVLEMDRGMEKARRLHDDFHLQYPQIGLARAHEQYAQPSVRQIAQVIAISSTLKELIARSKVSEALRNSHVDLNLYLSSAKRFSDTSIQCVELVTELAAPERGLEAQLEDLFAALETELDGNETLVPLFHEMKSFAQDYRIGRKRFLMQSAFNAAFNLREAMAREVLQSNRVQRIEFLLDHFTAVAEKILDVDVAIRSKINDFALQAEAADTVSTTLARLAGEEVDQARQRIAHAHRVALILIGGITLMGLIVAAGIATLLNNSITRRVVRLTEAAGELRKGSLDVFAPEAGRDELGQLARTFNVMAARIKELIDNLEQTVAQRTSELAASEKRFRELFEHSSSGVAVYEAVEDGKDFLIRDVNRACEAIEGVERGELLGKRLSEAFPGVVAVGLLDTFREVWRTGRSIRHPVSFYSDEKREGWRENSVYRLPTGEIVAIYEDRTAQKRAEIEKSGMEARLQRAQKMETIGLLAGGVAHDLNNILSGIIGYPDLLLLQIPEGSELEEPVKAIRESGQRAAAVVADLLTVARGVANAKSAVALNALIVDYLDSPEIRKLKTCHPHVECTTKLDPQLKNIFCSPVHIKKCVLNLLLNAMEAMDGAGRIVVSTFNTLVEEKKALENGIQPGEYVVIRVADSGKGISQQDLDRIFEPFYTKKVMGRSGTGLGLAVVWNSLMDHSGTVLVESSAGGTVFDLYFPASNREIDRAKGSEGIQSLKGHGEKILVVDDEPQQLDVVSRMVKVLGYEVACAGSGEKAVDYLRENRVDLVILDMLMEPGINGRQTYERILEIHPGQRAVIASGFSENEEVYRAQQLGARGFIKKPYSTEELGRMIQETLRG